MDDIYNLLKNEYRLKQSHIKILEELLKNNNLSAKELVFRTKIPTGSIYEFIRDLLDYGFLEQQLGKNPATYSVNNLDEKILEFIDKRFEEHLKGREKILKIVETKKTKREYKVFDNYDNFKIDCLKLSPSTNFLYGEIKEQKLPIIFFPKDKEKYKLYLEKIYDYDFNQINNILIENYWSIIDNVEEIKWIISKKDLTDYLSKLEKKLGKNEFKLRKNEIKNILKQKNIQIRVCSEPISYQYYITKTTLQIILMKNPFVGIIIPDLNVIKKYMQIFEDKFIKLDDVLKYL